MVASPQQWWERYSSRYRPSTTSRRTVGTESSNREQLSDLYVYPVAGTTTIANNQTKQVSFLNAENVTASKAYEQTFYFLESFESAISAEVRVRFANSRDGGLGEQLPSGIVRVYARDARDQPQFVGEDLIGHTSAGSELALKIGDAFDVTILPTLQTRSDAPRDTADHTMSYVVHNARTEAVTVTIRQDNLRRRNEVRAESLPGRRTDADSFAWDVPVPANGETELRVTFRQED
jgi:hypothetical protein